MCVAAILFNSTSSPAASCAQKNTLTGAATITTEVAPNCSQYLLLSSADYQQLQDPFHTSTVDKSAISFAFGACLLTWSLGLGLGMIINLIRRAR